MRISRSQGAAAKHQHRDEQHAFTADGVGERPEQQAADQQAEQPCAEGGGELRRLQAPLFAQRRGDIADDGGIEAVQQGDQEAQGEDEDLIRRDLGAIDDFADASGIWAHEGSTVIKLLWAG